MSPDARRDQERSDRKKLTKSSAFFYNCFSLLLSKKSNMKRTQLKERSDVCECGRFAAHTAGVSLILIKNAAARMRYAGRKLSGHKWVALVDKLSVCDVACKHFLCLFYLHIHRRYV